MGLSRVVSAAGIGLLLVGLFVYRQRPPEPAAIPKSVAIPKAPEPKPDAPVETDAPTVIEVVEGGSGPDEKVLAEIRRYDAAVLNARKFFENDGRIQLQARDVCHDLETKGVGASPTEILEGGAAVAGHGHTHTPGPPAGGDKPNFGDYCRAYKKLRLEGLSHEATIQELEKP
jgi:hypothetical protein